MRIFLFRVWTTRRTNTPWGTGRVLVPHLENYPVPEILVVMFNLKSFPTGRLQLLMMRVALSCASWEDYLTLAKVI